MPLFPYPNQRYTSQIGLALYGMDEILAENMLLIDGAFASGGTVNVNGSLVVNPNFNSTLPAAPGGDTNVTFQVDTNGNVSAYVPTAISSPPGGLNTQVQFNDGGVFGGAAGITWDKAHNLMLVGNTTQAGMDPAFEPQGSLFTVLNNCGSNNGYGPTGYPQGYAITGWAQSTDPSVNNNSIVGLYGLGEVIKTSAGSYGSINIGPQGAQLDGISSPSAGATIISCKGAQCIAIHNGAGTTAFMIAVDALSPVILGGGTATEAIGVHVHSQAGATTNFGLAIDGSYAGANDFAIAVNSLVARSFFGVINFGGTALVADTGISRSAAGTVAIGNGTAADFSGTLKATIVNAVTGYQNNSAIPTVGHVLRSNGTVFVDAALQAGDIPSLAYVTSFSAGSLSPLFTTNVATATTTPALSFSLSTQTANFVFAGPTAGAAAAPTFRALVSADLANTIVLASGIAAATQPPIDNSTLIATDAFVQTAVELSMATVPLSITGGTYSFASLGVNALVNYTATAGAITAITIWIPFVGSGYAIGDVVTPAGGNYDAMIVVTAISGTGAPTAGTILYGGTGYTSGTSKAAGVSISVPYTWLLSGTLTSNATFIMTPGTYLTQSNQWIFCNNTTGAFTVTVGVAGPGTDAASGGRTVVIPQGTNNSRSVMLQTDGELNTDLCAIINGADLTVGALQNGMAATTQSAGDNTTKIATDAFVQTAIGGAGAVLWSALGNAAADLTLANAGFKTTFNQTSAVAWLWANTTVGTISSTNASPLLELAANYWATGAATGVDLWTVGIAALTAGLNSPSTLTFTHTGSAGSSAVRVPLLDIGGTDAGISRLGAASLAIGNGTAGDFSGNLKLTTLTYADGSTQTSALKAHVVPLNATFDGGAINLAHGTFVSSNRAMKFDTTGYTQVRCYLEVTAVPTGSAITSVADASAGSTVYTGTITGGGSNGFANQWVWITGFTNAVNNGKFWCTASNATTLTLNNASGAAETHAANSVGDTIVPAYMAANDVNGNVSGTPIEIGVGTSGGIGSNLILSIDISLGRSFQVGGWVSIPAGMQNSDVWLVLRGFGGIGTSYSSEFGMQFR